MWAQRKPKGDVPVWCILQEREGGIYTVGIVDSQTHVYLNNHSLYLLHVGSPEGGAYCPLFIVVFLGF